jgi:hypothetical protein
VIPPISLEDVAVAVAVAQGALGGMPEGEKLDQVWVGEEEEGA